MWRHALTHHLTQHGTYFVTAGTYQRVNRVSAVHRVKIKPLPFRFRALRGFAFFPIIPARIQVA